MKIDHIECQVVCDDKVLTEYHEKGDEQRYKGCWIISETGKNFIVRMQSNPHEFDVCCNLWIDGNHLRKVVVQGSTVGEMNGARINSSTIRPFQFASIVLTDDDRALQESGSNLRDLGTICLKFYRIEDVQDIDLYRLPTCDIERAKKAGGHRVILGDAIAATPFRAKAFTFIDPETSPYYTFTWRYRSKNMLQAQGIVPLDPVPSPQKRPGPFASSDSSSKRPRTEQSTSHRKCDASVKLEPHLAYIPTARELQARKEAIKAQRAALQAQEAPFQAQRAALRALEATLQAQRTTLEVQETTFQAQKAALEVQEAALEEDFRRAAARGFKREASPITLLPGNKDVVDLTEDD
ncbi:hypothetical protein BC629DRAFT_931596 [Irpex lacteus]|nr:hypothetical protein BC629DRAFT_931596 [Irpex lacteus]